MVLSGSLQAVNVVYKISGDVLTQFLPVSGDLIADLLNGPRALNITIPATWRFNIDTDSAPFVLRDTSVGQTFVYSNAVTSMQSIYNGVEFSTLRPLQPGEVTMELTNSVAPIGLDVFDLKRYAVIAATVGQPLFNGFVVPFGQTTNGTLFENSNVSPSTLSVSLDQAGALDDAALPSQSGVFGSPRAPLFPLQGRSLAAAIRSGWSQSLEAPQGRLTDSSLSIKVSHLSSDAVS
jgi:hypothetical protein